MHGYRFRAAFFAAEAFFFPAGGLLSVSGGSASASVSRSGRGIFGVAGSGPGSPVGAWASARARRVLPGDLRSLVASGACAGISIFGGECVSRLHGGRQCDSRHLCGRVCGRCWDHPGDLEAVRAPFAHVKSCRAIARQEDLIPVPFDECGEILVEITHTESPASTTSPKSSK